MNLDCSFVKGNSHLICQDYALTFQHKDVSCALVSDGCSVVNKGNTAEPHPHSDLSSRLVAFAAKKVLTELIDYDEKTAILRSDFQTLFRSTLSSMGNILGIGRTVGDATLNLAYHAPGIVVSLMIGDGVTIIENEDQFHVRIRKFEPNMPYYISYMLDPLADKRYEAMDIRMYEEYLSINKKDWTYETTKCDKQVKLDEFVQIYEAQDVKSITVLSDGIEDIRQGRQLLVPEALQLLIPFKTKSGPFVQRRLRAFMRKIEKMQMIANDDVSIASIVL